mmetsp:Transcript_33560/g.60178  ORF Transcript_33560/g.60178 Transcript_33560/m.60178 type:complete len:95 (-) Transcript_33560:261-545(-)
MSTLALISHPGPPVDDAGMSSSADGLSHMPNPAGKPFQTTTPAASPCAGLNPVPGPAIRLLCAAAGRPAPGIAQLEHAGLQGSNSLTHKGPLYF